MSKIGSIYVTGIISPVPSDGFFSSEPTCSELDIRNQIQAQSDADEFVVYINSPGGSCDEGFAIKNTLQSTGKPITTRAVGTCASIATIIFLSGKKREVFSNTQLMIHLPLVYPNGALNETEIAKINDRLVQEKERILNEYINITGSDRESLEPLMVDETYLTSDQALELKFATEIITPILAIAKNKTMSKQTTVAAKALHALAKLMNVDLSEIKNVDATTNDGKTLSFEPAIEVGASVMMDGADAPDGTYTLEDNREVMVAGGKVTEIKDAPAADDSTDLKNKIDELTNQLTALQTENDTLKNEKTDLTTRLTNLETENGDIATKVDAMTAHLKTLNIKFEVPSKITTFNKKDDTTTFDAKAEKEKKDEFKKKVQGKK